MVGHTLHGYVVEEMESVMEWALLNTHLKALCFTAAELDRSDMRDRVWKLYFRFFLENVSCADPELLHRLRTLRSSDRQWSQESQIRDPNASPILIAGYLLAFARKSRLVPNLTIHAMLSEEIVKDLKMRDEDMEKNAAPNVTTDERRRNVLRFIEATTTTTTTTASARAPERDEEDDEENNDGSRLKIDPKKLLPALADAMIETETVWHEHMNAPRNRQSREILCVCPLPDDPSNDQNNDDEEKLHFIATPAMTAAVQQADDSHYSPITEAEHPKEEALLYFETFLVSMVQVLVLCDARFTDEWHERVTDPRTWRQLFPVLSTGCQTLSDEERLWPKDRPSLLLFETYAQLLRDRGAPVERFRYLYDLFELGTESWIPLRFVHTAAILTVLRHQRMGWDSSEPDRSKQRRVLLEEVLPSVEFRAFYETTDAPMASGRPMIIATRQLNVFTHRGRCGSTEGYGRQSLLHGDYLNWMPGRPLAASEPPSNPVHNWQLIEWGKSHGPAIARGIIHETVFDWTEDRITSVVVSKTMPVPVASRESFGRPPFSEYLRRDVIDYTLLNDIAQANRFLRSYVQPSAAAVDAEPEAEEEETDLVAADNDDGADDGDEADLQVFFVPGSQRQGAGVAGASYRKKKPSWYRSMKEWNLKHLHHHLDLQTYDRYGCFRLIYHLQTHVHQHGGQYSNGGVGRKNLSRYQTRMKAVLATAEQEEFEGKKWKLLPIFTGAEKEEDDDDADSSSHQTISSTHQLRETKARLTCLLFWLDVFLAHARWDPYTLVARQHLLHVEGEAMRELASRRNQALQNMSATGQKTLRIDLGNGHHHHHGSGASNVARFLGSLTGWMPFLEYLASRHAEEWHQLFSTTASREQARQALINNGGTVKSARPKKTKPQAAAKKSTTKKPQLDANGNPIAPKKRGRPSKASLANSAAAPTTTTTSPSSSGTSTVPTTATTTTTKKKKETTATSPSEAPVTVRKTTRPPAKRRNTSLSSSRSTRQLIWRCPSSNDDDDDGKKKKKVRLMITLAYDPAMMTLPVLEELEMTCPNDCQVRLPSDPEALAACVRPVSNDKEKRHDSHDDNDHDDDDTGSVHELEDVGEENIGDDDDDDGDGDDGDGDGDGDGYERMNITIEEQEREEEKVKVSLQITQGDSAGIARALREQWGCESELVVEKNGGAVFFCDRPGDSQRALDRVLFWLLGSSDVSLDNDTDRTLDEPTRAIVRERMRTWVNVLRTFDWARSPFDRPAVSARWKRLRELSAAVTS